MSNDSGKTAYSEDVKESTPLPDDFEDFVDQGLAGESTDTVIQDCIEISSPASASDPHYPIPNLSELTQVLLDQRLMVLSGELSDKRSVARRVAWEFAQARKDLSADNVIAAEFRHTTDSRSLLQLLDATTVPTVFVFPDSEPHQFGGNLQRLYRNTRQLHWVILTTERPRSSWMLQEEVETCWTEPQRSSLYSPGALERYLVSRFKRISGNDEPSLKWKDGVSVELRDLATRLETPESIQGFVVEYTRLNELQLEVPPVIERLIENSKSPPEIVHSWFTNQLNDREKTVAIAMALLYGLDETVAFDVIEHLMEGVWRRRDTSFRFIDYGDLLNLGAHIEFQKDAQGVARIMLKGADTRFYILQAAWPTHRRQIIAALSSLSILARDSIKGSASSISSFRHRQVRDQFRRTTGESLGDAARMSLESIEPLLLILVSDGRLASHMILADALGQLRSANESHNIFKMLSSWRGQGEIHRYLASTRTHNDSVKIDGVIGAAIAIAIGRLALYDRPNAINKDIVDLLKAYCKSERPQVISALSHHAIRHLIPVHWIQMKTMLPDLFDRVGTKSDLAEYLTIGSGIGLGYGLLGGRSELIDLARKWINEGIENIPTTFDETEVNDREKKLASAVYAVSLSRNTIHKHQDTFDRTHDSLFGVQSSTISPKEAGDILLSVLSVEPHPFVRQAAVTAMEYMLENEFESVLPSFEKALVKLDPIERRSIIRAIVRFHREQRSKLEGGDSIVKVGSYDFPIWFDKDAPNTKIQSQIFDWAAHAREERLSAFAGDIVMTIRREVERTEELELKTIREKREADQLATEKRKDDNLDQQFGHTLKLSFIQRSILVPLATGASSELKVPVAGQLAIAIPLDEDEQQELIERYSSAGEHALAKGLRKALWLNKHKSALFWLIIGIVIVFKIFVS